MSPLVGGVKLFNRLTVESGLTGETSISRHSKLGRVGLDRRWSDGAFASVEVDEEDDADTDAVGECLDEGDEFSKLEADEESDGVAVESWGVIGTAAVWKVYMGKASKNS